MPYITVAEDLTFHYVIPTSKDPLHPKLDPEKETLLLLHPRMFDLQVLEPQFACERLSKKYNLLAIDQHWHGLTKIPLDDKPYDYWKVTRDLLAVLDALGVKTCHVFGLQHGAILAVRMCIADPKRFTSMVLCAMPPPKDTPQNIEQYHWMRDVCRDSHPDDPDSVPQEILTAGGWIYFGKTKDAYLFPIWVKRTNFKATNQMFLDKFFSALWDRDVLSEAQWATITCPVLLIQGDGDPVYPIDAIHANYKALTHAPTRLHIIQDGPMFLSWTNPDEVNKLTADFIDEHRRK
ncbi:alpha/beta-hydrolase [Serendipita vermifera]|nr:alpha/beta-hydrolase [Serendipita vermifera]